MALTALRPFPKFSAFDAIGNVLAGGKLYTYSAGTSTALTTYTDSTGVTANANPVILDVNGQADVWFQPLNYKLVLKDADDNLLWSVDNYSGSPYPITDEWITYIHTWTFISATQVSVPGDQTAIYQANKAVRAACTAGTFYGNLTSAVYDGSTKTTLTVSFDVGSFDSGVAGSSKVSIGVQSNQSPALIAAGQAATSASTASTAATNAGNSATAAAGSASAASTSATNAGNSATAAAGSATTAGTHATNAGNSATAAATSATNAGTSATNAANSATAAATSATDAQSAATSAAAIAGATKWVSGSYAEGVAVWSPANGQTYRRKAPGGASPTDPASDATNWTYLGGVSSVNGQTGAVTGIATTAANTFSGAQRAPAFVSGTVVNAATTGAISLDLSLGDTFDLTLTGNVTSCTFTNVPTLTATEELPVVIRVRQGATAYSFAYPTTATWFTSGGTAPATPAANKVQEYLYTKLGTNGWTGRKGAGT